jgi:DNA-binding NtrC family response regulator
MQTSDILLLQSDPRIADMLMRSLNEQSQRVRLTKSVEDLIHAAAKHQPRAIVLDLETASLTDLKVLKEQFQGIRIVCNHRIADEEMWTETLGAGADDFCPSADTRAILHAVVGAPPARAVAA